MVRSAHKMRALAVIAACIGTLACSLMAPDSSPGVQRETVNISGAPDVQLAAPLDGAVYREGVAVNILARVLNAGDDVERVEILVDNQIVTTIPLPNPAGAPEFSVAQSWTSTGNGPHTIGLTVFRSDGSSSAPVSRTIEVLGTSSQVINVPESEEQPTDGMGSVVGEQTEETPAPTQEIVVSQPSQEDAEPLPEQEVAEPAEPTQAEPTAVPPTATPSVPTATLLVGANVRSGPGTAFLRIGSFAANTQTEALAVTADRSWYKIRYYNNEGWIAAQLVDVQNGDGLPIDNGPPPPTPVPPTATPIPATEAPAANSNLAFNGNIEIQPFPPNCGDTMKFTIPIKNDGPQAFGTTAAAIIRDVHIDSGARAETIAAIPNLGPGESATIRDIFLTVDTNFDSRHRIEVILDSNGQIAETNEGDNSFSGNEYTLNRGTKC